jgi:hypothetical protein
MRLLTFPSQSSFPAAATADQGIIYATATEGNDKWCRPIPGKRYCATTAGYVELPVQNTTPQNPIIGGAPKEESA